MTSFVDVIRPSNKIQRFLFDVASILGCSFLIALAAQIAIPCTPVPMTLQVLVVLLIGAVLGSKKGAMAVLTYLAEGAIGLPVFATGKSILNGGPTCGYLFGFVIAAYLIGFLLERGPKEKFLYTVFAMSLGTLVILLLGASWLSFYVGGFTTAIKFGVLPFLVGDCVKILVAAALVPSCWKLIGALQQ
jgi:biotin transport system substrate-specific component